MSTSTSTPNSLLTSYKITILGDSKVGKKSFLKRLTLGSSLSLWNSQGTYEILPTNTPITPADYTDETVLYILVFLYDLSRLDSLTYMIDLYKKLKTEIGVSFSMVFAGNKSDLIQHGKILQTKAIVKKQTKEKNFNSQQFFISLKDNMNVPELITQINNCKRTFLEQKRTWYMMITQKVLKKVQQKNQKTMKQLSKQVDDQKWDLAEKDRIIDTQARHIKKSQQKIDQLSQLNKNLQKNMNKIISKIKFFNSKSEINVRRLSELRQRRKLKRKRILEQKGTLSDMMQEIHEVANQSSVDEEVRDQSVIQAAIVVKDKVASKSKKVSKK